jgi:hypothetical protein
MRRLGFLEERALALLGESEERVKCGLCSAARFTIIATQQTIERAMERCVAAAIAGGPNFRMMREFIRHIREIGREAKKRADDVMDDDDDK